MSHPINTLIAEDKAYYEWAKQEKRRILAIHNAERKQREWSRVFGIQSEPDDSYLSGNIF